MLRASSEYNDKTVSVGGIVAPEKADFGIEHQEMLLAFAEAAVLNEQNKLVELRRTFVDTLGPKALVEAACVVGNFERMNRIADACGISLGPLEVMAEDIINELGIDHMESAKNTKPITGMKRFVMKLMMPFMMKQMLRPADKPGAE